MRLFAPQPVASLRMGLADAGTWQALAPIPTDPFLSPLQGIVDISHSNEEASITFEFDSRDALHDSLSETPPSSNGRYRNARLRMNFGRGLQQIVAGSARVEPLVWTRRRNAVVTARLELRFFQALRTRGRS